jgi:small subunit ribosomal protein S20
MVKNFLGGERVPQHKSAEKALRQSEKRRLRNRMFKTRVKTEIKKFLAYLEAGDLEKAEQQLRVAQSLLHRGVNKGIFHKNKAGNKISKLFIKLNQAKAKASAQTVAEA